jgi:hypothetical protein
MAFVGAGCGWLTSAWGGWLSFCCALPPPAGSLARVLFSSDFLFPFPSVVLAGCLDVLSSFAMKAVFDSFTCVKNNLNPMTSSTRPEKLAQAPAQPPSSMAVLMRLRTPRSSRPGWR